MKYIRDPITRFCKNKGFTLVEIVAAISITCILSMAVFSIYMFFIRNFKASVISNKEEFYINESFRYIESEILKGNKEVKFNQNSIELKRYLKSAVFEEVDYIRLEGNRLVIVHTKMGYHEATNVFLRNITGFNTEKNGEVVVINIITDKGEKYSKCLNTMYIK